MYVNCVHAHPGTAHPLPDGTVHPFIWWNSPSFIWWNTSSFIWWNTSPFTQQNTSPFTWFVPAMTSTSPCTHSSPSARVPPPGEWASSLRVPPAPDPPPLASLFDCSLSLPRAPSSSSLSVCPSLKRDWLTSLSPFEWRVNCAEPNLSH